MSPLITSRLAVRRLVRHSTLQPSPPPLTPTQLHSHLSNCLPTPNTQTLQKFTSSNKLTTMAPPQNKSENPVEKAAVNVTDLPLPVRPDQEIVAASEQLQVYIAWLERRMQKQLERERKQAAVDVKKEVVKGRAKVNQWRRDLKYNGRIRQH